MIQTTPLSQATCTTELPMGAANPKKPVFRCSFSLQIFKNAMIARCGYTFEADFFQQDQRKQCPIDKRAFTGNDLRDNLVVTEPSKKVGKKIEKRKTETTFEQSIIDRCVVQIMKQSYQCPLLQKTLKDPVVARCGHTFERGALQNKPKCPFDAQEVSQEDLVENVLVKGHLEYLQNYTVLEIVPSALEISAESERILENYHKAEKLFQEAVRVNPESFFAHERLGV